MQRRGKITGIHWTIVIKEEMTTGLGVRLGPETHSGWWSVNNVNRKKEPSIIVQLKLGKAQLWVYIRPKEKIDLQVNIVCGREEGRVL